MLDAGQSAHSIASATGLHVSTISRFCSKENSELQKAAGGCPSKLSSANICHAICLISSGKAENAVQVTKALTNVVNQSLSATSVCWHLKKTGMKAVIKSRCPSTWHHHTSWEQEIGNTHSSPESVPSPSTAEGITTATSSSD